MPENLPAMIPAVAGGRNNIPGGVLDDDDFGDFVFSSPSTSSHTPAFFPYPSLSQHAAADDEDWGDFVTRPPGSLPLQYPFDPFPEASLQDSSLPEPSPVRGKAWEKPAGALPLSIFGEEESGEPETVFENGLASGSFSNHSSPRAAAAGELKDLIESLYEQNGVETKGAMAATSRKEGDDDFDESSWEFKDAFSADATPKKDEGDENIFGLGMVAAANENGTSQDTKELEWNMWDSHDLPVSAYANGKKNSYGYHTGNGKMDYSPVALTSIIHDLYVKADRPHATVPSRSPINDGQEIDQHGKLSPYVNGGNDFDQFDWEIQNAVVSKANEKVTICESGQTLSSESNSCALVEHYCRLKEESLSFIVHHLGILKIPALPGETAEVKKINVEIREAYGNLQEMLTSENARSSKKIEGHFNQLLKITREANFKAVEQEYHVSERLLSAENDLNAAVELFEHSSSVLQILRLASREQQLLYINSWSKLASACAQELQHGAKILTELLDDNIRKQLLSKGNKYFTALGEIYRVSKILKATVRLYMPWLLSNLECSCEMIAWLEKCSEVWNNSGLEKSLQSISSNKDIDDEGLTKALLDSIKLIDEVNEPTFHDPSFNLRHGVCRFSLLPLDKLPGIKAVIWNGDWYITKLANLWANRISIDPPVLPFIMAS